MIGYANVVLIMHISPKHYRSEKREMAAGEGTGRAGQPPLMENRVPAIS
jgi:hypothetical protein